ncbi:MAG: TrkA family potassium uptake protein [Eubacteriales bacterium]|nr:TrkA family potassium uptake protein [Eubacteriales bacterium]
MKKRAQKKPKKQFVVIGLGRFGRSVAKHLEKNGCNVMAIDEDEKKVNMISEYVTSAMCLDISDEEVVKELGLSNFDGAVISIVHSLEKAVLATICVKENGIGQVVVEAYDETQGKVLKKLGADVVVYPEREMGVHLANNLAFDNFLDAIELTSDYSIADIQTPKDWVGKNLIELNLRAKYDVNIIAIKRGTKVDMTPPADIRLAEEDVLMVLGENNILKKLSHTI